MEVLRQHEHLVNFKAVPYRGISEGRQSKVSVLEYSTENQPRRVLWKRMGVGKALSAELARTLHSRLRPYKRALEDFGLNVPVLYHTQPVELDSEAQIFSYEELITGGDSEFMVANREEPNFRKWFILRAVLETLAGYPEQSLRRKVIAGQEVSLMPHGLDLKLANVVLNEQGKLYFVDLFGPKEIDQSGHWLTYTAKLDSLPEENLLAVTASREGALLRFYRLAEKIWVENCALDSGKIRAGFNDLLAESNLPEKEKRFIVSQLQENFSWLDEVYSERQV